MVIYTFQVFVLKYNRNPWLDFILMPLLVVTQLGGLNNRQKRWGIICCFCQFFFFASNWVIDSTRITVSLEQRWQNWEGWDLEHRKASVVHLTSVRNKQFNFKENIISMSFSSGQMELSVIYWCPYYVGVQREGFHLRVVLKFTHISEALLG